MDAGAARVPAYWSPSRLLAFALVLATLAFPILGHRNRIPIYDWILAALGVAACLYLVIFRFEIADRPGLWSTSDIDVVLHAPKATADFKGYSCLVTKVLKYFDKLWCNGTNAAAVLTSTVVTPKLTTREIACHHEVTSK